jgi:hypothetical protein
MNVVDLLTRYPVRGRFDARENRLTAALAAVLGVSETFCARFVQDLWPPDPSACGRGPWEVVIQKPVFPAGRRRACFIDVEIRGIHCPIRMWIEAKVASKLSGPDQLAKYADALKREPEDYRLLVLLAPERRRKELEKHLPRNHEVPTIFRSWSDVHRVLDDWQREPNRRHRERWLGREVMAYMRDQGHGSVRKLTQKQRQIVDGFDEAQNAVWHLLERASDRLKSDWHANGAPQGRKRWEGSGEQRFRPSSDRGGMRRDYREFCLNFELPLSFGAGVYFRPLSEPKKVAVKDYASRDGWRCDVDGRVPWLWRDMPIDDLLAQPDLEAQAGALAVFARETFKMLEDSPPDPTSPRRG